MDTICYNTRTRSTKRRTTCVILNLEADDVAFTNSAFFLFLVVVVIVIIIITITIIVIFVNHELQYNYSFKLA